MADNEPSILLLGLAASIFLFSFTSARTSLDINSSGSIKPNSYHSYLSTPSGNYTFVCNPRRYNDLGLNMKDFAFCDKTLSYEVRVKDLVDELTLKEKAIQLGDTATAISRIGLPLYEWWSEALHGISNFGGWNPIHPCFFDDLVPGATSFPTVITSAASFNQSLWKTIGQAISTEARAMYNVGHAGLTFWSPNINLVRDPRWGRALEVPGEDPYVVGEYAVNFVRGLQDVEGFERSNDPNSRPLKVSACCKHYAAYDVDNWQGTKREGFNAIVREQDMMETFLKPFEMCVKEGDVSSVMCSYNQINGIPSCADPRLLKGKIRGEWDLHGYIVSDCDAINEILYTQKWLRDEPEDAVAQALKAGMDMECGSYYTKYAESSVKVGKVREKEMDDSLKNLYTVLMRVGYFDGSPQYAHLGLSHVCSHENIQLATEAARQGAVLLKNLHQTLPWNPQQINTIAVIGPHANATTAMIGNYAGIPCRYTSPIDGLSKYAHVVYERGCADIACKNDSLIFKAVQAAKKADATVLIIGLDLSVEAEALDRTDLLLPGYQTKLIQQVASQSKGPLVLVVMTAGGVDISFARDSSDIPSILWVGYPGEEGGQAIADVIFGKYNPGGRLPLTWFENSYVSKLPMTSMPLRPIDSLGYPGRTYKFYNGSRVYPFGYGLSYTNFTYSLARPTAPLQLQLNQFQHCRDLNYTQGSYKPSCPAVLIDDIKCDDSLNVQVSVQVENTGERDGSEVVIVYWTPPEGIVDGPIKQVVAFRRVFVSAGGSETVNFELNACKSLAVVDYKGYNLLPAGGGKFVIGEGMLTIPTHLEFVR